MADAVAPEVDYLKIESNKSKLGGPNNIESENQSTPKSSSNMEGSELGGNKKTMRKFKKPTAVKHGKNITSTEDLQLKAKLNQSN